jgi:GNAT superfamily N-acetyltransferase
VTRSGAWIGEVRRYFIVPERGAYIYESFTNPDLRGRGIYPAMLNFIATEAAQRGLGELWIGVGASNRPSVRAIAKGAFEPAFDIVFRRRLGAVRIETITGPRSDEASQVIQKRWPIHLVG